MARDYYVIVTVEQAGAVLETLPDISTVCTRAHDMQAVHSLQEQIEGIPGWRDRGVPWKQLVLNKHEALWLQTISDALELEISVPGMQSEAIHRESETTGG